MPPSTPESSNPVMSDSGEGPEMRTPGVWRPFLWNNACSAQENNQEHSVRELENLRAPSPGFTDQDMTRKASLHHGKVKWLQPAPPPKVPPKRPARPDAPWSEEHPAFRQKPALSASHFTYNPTQLLRSVSKSSFKRGAGRPRTANGDAQAAGQPRMEEVGVGAWRVCDDK